LTVRKINLHVVADDLGTCVAVDEGILHCRLEGILTAASIAVNGDTACAAVEAAKAVKLNLGVHVNLVEGKPISAPETISTLVDGNGRFWGTSTNFFARYWRGRIDSTHIHREAKAQIKWLIDRGVHPTHIDSHQHIHIWRSLLPLFAELAKKYEIKRIRLPSLPLEPGNGNIGNWLKYSALCYLGAMGRARTTQNGISVTDRLWGLMVTGEIDKDYLLRVLHTLPPGIHELLCHPSAEDVSCGGKNWHHHGQQEMEALTDPEVQNMINHRGIVIIR
jgi:predicted glycoside hydrolase/deacetylase ChbG (UPF0249 family)